MTFYNWSLIKTRTLHPDIGIPADDTQGLPYLTNGTISPYQNYGLVSKAYSGEDSITGYLFTANKRYLLGSGEVKSLDYVDNDAAMFAIDSLSGHVFATTASGVINNPISINGNKLGWTGIQSDNIISGRYGSITFFQYSGSNYVGFGQSVDNNFAIFKPGGAVNLYSNYNNYGCLQPCTFYNGLYTILYESDDYGDNYGFVPLADAPEITPVFASSKIISYSFNESAIFYSLSGSNVYGYNGIGDPTLASSFIKASSLLYTSETFGYDPFTGRLLSLGLNTVTIGGYVYYPVYVYDSLITSTPQQYARPVKNFTVNGHLNWRKQR